LYKDYLSYTFFNWFFGRSLLKRGFYSLGTVKAAFLAFGTTAFGFFKGALHTKRLAV
jgi:hypothetical protein